MDTRIFTRPRGLAAVSRDRLREIASLGGQRSGRMRRLAPEERHELAMKGARAAVEARLMRKRIASSLTAAVDVTETTNQVAQAECSEAEADAWADEVAAKFLAAQARVGKV